MLKTHPYFSVDLERAQTLQQCISQIQPSIGCMKSKSGDVYTEDDPRLWFDSNNPDNYDELFRYLRQVATEAKVQLPRQTLRGDLTP